MRRSTALVLILLVAGCAPRQQVSTTPTPAVVVPQAEEPTSLTGLTAQELVGALDTTFAIIDHCLDRWTPDVLEQTVERTYADSRQIHSRASILQRLLTHEAYHCGELSQTLGIAGLPQIYLWRPD